MKTLKKILPLLVVGTLALASCKKEGCIDPAAINYNDEAKKDDGSCEYLGQGTVSVEMSHVWGMGGAPFALNTELIHPMTNDTMTYSTFKYYISNFELKSTDGTWWKHPESYFLVDASVPASLTLGLSGVPEGGYTDIRYTMGVDSTRNVSGAQTGALSTTNGMFWSWSTGYIMVKAEGVSPNAASGSFSFHLGGFSGANNIVTTKENAFGGTLNVTKTGSPKVLLSANAARMFHSYGSISSGSTVHMPGANAVTLADGFYGGVNFVGIQQ
jgi:hypothetical protein